MILELRISVAEVLERYGDVSLEILFARGDVSRYYKQHRMGKEELFFASSNNLQQDTITVRELLDLKENLTVSRANGYLFIQTKDGHNGN